MELTEDQQLYLRLVFERFHRSGKWPVLRDVQRQMIRQTGRSIDVTQVVNQLPPAVHPFTSHLQNEAILNVAALTLVDDAAEELADFLALLGLAVEKYLGPEDEPTISSRDLAGRFGMNELRLRKVGALLRLEGLITSGGVMSESPYEWSYGVSDYVHRFAGAHTIEDYLEARDRPVPHSLETAVAVASEAPITADAPSTADVGTALDQLLVQQARPRSPFEDILLERDQMDLLSMMVEADRRVPREQSHLFILSGTHEGYSLIHAGLQDEGHVVPGDVRTLAEAGLLRHSVASKSANQYEVTPTGRAYYAWMKEREGEPIKQIETEVRHLIDSDEFRKRHATAYDRWTDAESQLWGAETAAEFTDIGHACREAVQQFVNDLVKRHHAEGVEADPQKTVARLRAVLATAGPSERDAAFAEALLTYFGAVSDLIQRQEHGALKEGEPLTWEDARRVVFQAALVMFELDRALG